ncbi:hypothetical protein [Rhodococcus koreensis]|uniref:hypothetical protein n=1 Tax=Rhodococcus koreensis TaxID=99653 RepID=UPI00197D7F54|nr:hypothetical protein [Rhodococcus koreensis]QSE86560.1 hypothetical protein JWS14_42820 [Rhodococcus koreensis]
MHTMAVRQRADRQALTPRIAADVLEKLHPRLQPEPLTAGGVVVSIIAPTPVTGIHTDENSHPGRVAVGPLRAVTPSPDKGRLGPTQAARPGPLQTARASSTLIDAFASLSRGKAKLGVAGKILSGTVAQLCLDRGADFVLIGTAAILHHDFAARVLADPAFTSLCQPVSRRHLETQHLGGAFIDYLATDWDDFVA